VSTVTFANQTRRRDQNFRTSRRETRNGDLRFLVADFTVAGGAVFQAVRTGPLGPALGRVQRGVRRAGHDAHDRTTRPVTTRPMGISALHNKIIGNHSDHL